MYRTGNQSQVVMRFSMAVLTAVFMMAIYGCSESNDSNSTNPVGPQTPAETNWNAPQDADAVGEYNVDRPQKPRECIIRKEGYVTFQNRFNCEPIDVLVDHKVIVRLEPNTGITAALRTGKHSLAFARVKGGKIIRQSVVVLEPCDELYFATERDICAEAIK